MERRITHDRNVDFPQSASPSSNIVTSWPSSIFMRLYMYISSAAQEFDDTSDRKSNYWKSYRCHVAITFGRCNKISSWVCESITVSSNGMRSSPFPLICRLGAGRCSHTTLYTTRGLHWRTVKNKLKRDTAQLAAYFSKMEEKDYTAWSHEKLIEKVTQLENELKSKSLKSVLLHSFWRYMRLTQSASHLKLRSRKRSHGKSPGLNENLNLPYTAPDWLRWNLHISERDIMVSSITEDKLRPYQRLKRSYGKL